MAETNSDYNLSNTNALFVNQIAAGNESPFMILNEEKRKLERNAARVDSIAQIGAYVREAFEDSQGRLWFGTSERGVACYEHEMYTYFTVPYGLADNQINGIDEDAEGNLWFATANGVSTYDGKTFTTYREKEGLADNVTWSILSDSNGNIWVGTLKGVSLFNGHSFENVTLPNSVIQNPSFAFNLGMIWNIIEDKKGNIWIGTDGYGVYKYNGSTFEQYTKNDGLCNNSITSMLEDDLGNIWFGSSPTRVPESPGSFKYVDSDDSGLCLFDGQTFTDFQTTEGLYNNDIGPIYQDKTGNIWVSSKHYGVFRLDSNADSEITLFIETSGRTNNCNQSILEDSNGNMWFGFSGGLFKLEDEVFVNITRNGGC